jgi:hypothetical protein
MLENLYSFLRLLMHTCMFLNRGLALDSISPLIVSVCPLAAASSSGVSPSLCQARRGRNLYSNGFTPSADNCYF